MEQKITITQRIGEFISTLLLGKTKELIIRTDEKVRDLSNIKEMVIRTDEKVQGLMKTTDKIQYDMSSLKSDIIEIKADIRGLKVHTGYRHA